MHEHTPLTPQLCKTFVDKMSYIPLLIAATWMLSKSSSYIAWFTFHNTHCSFNAYHVTLQHALYNYMCTHYITLYCFDKDSPLHLAYYSWRVYKFIWNRQITCPVNSCSIRVKSALSTMNVLLLVAILCSHCRSGHTQGGYICRFAPSIYVYMSLSKTCVGTDPFVCTLTVISMQISSFCTFLVVTVYRYRSLCILLWDVVSSKLFRVACSCDKQVTKGPLSSISCYWSQPGGKKHPQTAISKQVVP